MRSATVNGTLVLRAIPAEVLASCEVAAGAQGDGAEEGGEGEGVHIGVQQVGVRTDDARSSAPGGR
jgi:hypothetical protein